MPGGTTSFGLCPKIRTFGGGGASLNVCMIHTSPDSSLVQKLNSIPPNTNIIFQKITTTMDATHDQISSKNSPQDWSDFISNTAKYFSKQFENFQSNPPPKKIEKVEKEPRESRMAAYKLRLEKKKADRMEKEAREKIAKKELTRLKKEADKAEKMKQLNEKLEQRRNEKQKAIASLIEEKVKRLKAGVPAISEKTLAARIRMGKKSKKSEGRRNQLKNESDNDAAPSTKVKILSKTPKISLFEFRNKNTMKEENAVESLTFISGVPKTRSKEITGLAKSARRQYKSDYTEYFKNRQSVDLRSSDGQVCTNSKRTRDLIVSQANKILLEKDADMDQKQKEALQEVCKVPKVEKQYPCKDCSKSFNSTNGLFTHHKNVHQKRLEKKCARCNLQFENQTLHRIHQKEFHPRPKIDNICPVCEKSFTNKHTRNKHLKSIHDDTKFKCKFCEKTFNWRENQKRHIRQVHTDLRPFQCADCQLFFNDSGNLKRHIQSRHLMKRIPCTFEHCEKICFDKGDLSRHVAEKHSEPLICNICEKDFATFYGLSIHKNKNHAEVPREYPCSQCATTFLAPQDRSEHFSLKHRKEKVKTEFKCRYCPEKFSSQNARRAHYSTHPGEKYMFSCIFCGVKKPSEIRLDLHEKECYKAKMESAKA